MTGPRMPGQAGSTADAGAAFRLGERLQEEDDLSGAKAAFREALDSRDLEYAPWAAVHLGEILQDEGDTGAARAAFEAAMAFTDTESPDPAFPAAALYLGFLLKDAGDDSNAQDAFQAACDSGIRDYVALAACELGHLLSRQGQINRAVEAYQEAISSSDSGYPMAEFALGVTWHNLGNYTLARSAYQAALDSKHPPVAWAAAKKLGDLLADVDDIEGARAAYQLAIGNGDPEVSAEASAALRHLLGRQGSA